jgi:uncharacterized protein YegL
VRYDREKKKQERDEIITTVKKAINDELIEIRKGIYGYQEIAEKDKKQGKLWRPYIDLSTDSKDSIVYSGRFALLDFDLQRKISHIYVVIERAEKILEKISDHMLFIDQSLKSYNNIDKAFKKEK